ncbi:MAG: hypothetical protein ACK4VY_08625 [Brevundimonas sp.]
MIVAWFVAAAVSSATLPISPVEGTPPLQLAPAKTIATLRDQLGAALRAEDVTTALALAKALADHPEFAAQPADQRDAVIVLLGLLYGHDGQYAAAVPYLITASERPGASPDLWLARITAHARTDDRTAAARALTRFLSIHPDRVSDLSGAFIVQLEGSSEVDVEARFELRRALRDAGWRDRYDSSTWLRLIDDFIKRDRLLEAVPLVERIGRSGSVIHLYAMRRYDDLRAAAAMPELDIEAVLDAELATQRTEAEAPGARVEVRNAYASGLFNRGRFDEALTFTDATLALPAPSPGSEDDKSLNWTMDTRARLLIELGRLDEAISQMEIAAKRDEGAGVNVSQTINLGWFYLRAGQNALAIETVKSLEAGTASPFGVMQAMHVRACAGAALGDARVAGLAFRHMEQNWRDAPLTWVEAQACRGDADGAANTLLLILADDELSPSGVSAMHTYRVEQRATDYDRRIAETLAVAFARSDVVAARDRIARALVLPTLNGQF